MSKVVINSYEEFERLLGQQIGVSDWLEVTQERINQFADATLDHQWIHVDVERAKTESPFKSTIVHGYLTLSLLPYFWNQIIEVNNLKMMVNYGMDKMRFGKLSSSSKSRDRRRKPWKASPRSCIISVEKNEDTKAHPFSSLRMPLCSRFLFFL